MRSRRLGARTLKSVERLLEKKQAQLRGALSSRTRERRLSDPTRVADSAVWAAESLTESIEAALLERQRLQLTQVEAALERLRPGQYGTCRDCAEPIELSRLQALPLTPRCAGCQRRAETHARGHGAPVAVARAAPERD